MKVITILLIITITGSSVVIANIALGPQQKVKTISMGFESSPETGEMVFERAMKHDSPIEFVVRDTNNDLVFSQVLENEESEKVVLKRLEHGDEIYVYGVGEIDRYAVLKVAFSTEEQLSAPVGIYGGKQVTKGSPEVIELTVRNETTTR